MLTPDECREKTQQTNTRSNKHPLLVTDHSTRSNEKNIALGESDIMSAPTTSFTYGLLPCSPQGQLNALTSFEFS
jgi:hypothetical protein